ncbi:PD-(D/E)XK nuclease family protein [Thiospirillum jenense]
MNDTIAIPIEDKIGTREHSNQLQRYLEILEKVR